MMIEDIDLGHIRLIANARSKRIVVRYRDGMFHLTHPMSVSRRDISQAIEEMRPRLKALMEKAPVKFMFANDTEFETISFSVRVLPNQLKNIYTTLKDGVLSISYPETLSLDSDEMQSYLRKTIESACRREAKQLVPQRVLELAQQNGFDVNEVKINNSRSRWGSCSSKKNINISYYCMMLPSNLLDFVILHELCHTVEMNHGERFWHLLDTVTDNRAKMLTKELKAMKLKW